MKHTIITALLFLALSCATMKTPDSPGKSVVIAYWSDSLIVIDKDLARRLKLQQGYTIKSQEELKRFLQVAAKND